MLPRILVYLIVALFPVSVEAFDWEHVGVLGRGVWPHLYNYGDSLIEKTDNGFYFNVVDTFGNIGRQERFRRDSIRIKPRLMYLGDGWFDVVANRRVERIDHYAWPYLYRLHVNDTAFVEDRFREIDLPQYCQILDAKPIIGGGYILLYTYGGDEEWYRACRVTDDGDTLWTELILEHYGDFRGYTRITGILPSSSNPIQYYIYGHHFIFDGRVGATMANITLIDTSGAIIWNREHYWGGVPVHITSMEAFDDGTYAIIGTRLRTLQYLHIADNGDSLASYRYGPTYTFAYSSTKSLVVGGERLLILTNFEDVEGWPRGYGPGLIYLNEEGDSLDGCYFHPDTVKEYYNGPMLERPNGKVMLWMRGEHPRIITDILYTFYPDGRPPDGVEGDFTFRPSAFILHPNYPNPFNGITSIGFSVNHGDFIRLRIYDQIGRLVSTPYEGYIEPGSHRTIWDANMAPAGTYIVKLDSRRGWSDVNRVVLIK